MAKYPKGTMFQGNRFIRKSGFRVGYNEHSKQEFLKCMKDCVYFIENYVKIKNVDTEELILFKLRDYQLEIVKQVVGNREYILTMGRQGGKTSTISAVILWYLIFMRNYGILVAAHKGDKARDVLAVIKTMYENLPEWLQHGVLEWNKGSIVLETNSHIRASSTSGTSARGDVVNFCYVDEVAFIATHICDAFFKSVLPSISSGQTTKIVLSSTPQGLNAFHKLWKAAITGKSGYAWTKVEWNKIPGRTEAFKQKIIAQFGDQYWNQEYAAEFLGSSFTLISASKLLDLMNKTLIPVHTTAEVKIYAPPQKDRVYVLASDVSEGVLGDYSTGVVFDVTMLPYTVAAIYRSNIVSTMALPSVLFNMARSYNNAMTMIETTGIGQEVANILLVDLEYENVGMTKSSSKFGQIFGGEFLEKARIGLRMDKRVKAIGCGKLKALVEADQLLIPDDDLVDELQRFTAKGKSYEAIDGHDDLVMSCVTFAWMAEQGYLREMTDTNAAAAIAQRNAQSIEDSLTPVLRYNEPPRDVPIAVKEGSDDWIRKSDYLVDNDPPIVKLW